MDPERSPSPFRRMLLSRHHPDIAFCVHTDCILTVWKFKETTFELSHVIDSTRATIKKGEGSIGLINGPLDPLDIACVTMKGSFCTWHLGHGARRGSGPGGIGTIRVECDGAPAVKRLAPTTAVLRFLTAPVSTIAMSHTAKHSLLAVSTTDGHLVLLDPQEGSAQKRIQVSASASNSVLRELHWLSSHVIVSYAVEMEGKLYRNQIWATDIRTGVTVSLRPLARPESVPIVGVRLSPSRNFLAVLLREKPFEVWDVSDTTKPATRLNVNAAVAVSAMEWVASPGSEAFVVATHDGERHPLM